MRSLITKINVSVENPNGLRLVGDDLVTPNVPILHDWTNAATYPSQAAVVPIGTTFVNISPNTTFPSVGFQTKNATMPYDASGFIKFSQPNTASWAEIPSPTPWSNQATDMLFTFRIRPYKYTTSGVANIFYTIGQYGGANNNFNAHLILGHGQSNNEMYIFALGLQVNAGDMFWTDSAWQRVSVYISPQGVNGPGFINVYKDGSLLKQISTSRTSFSADVSPSQLNVFKPQFGGEGFDISYFRVMSGLFEQGLDPINYA